VLGLALLGVPLALLVGAGLVSLAGGRVPGAAAPPEAGERAPDVRVDAPGDAPNDATDDAQPGPYLVPADPLVSYVLQPEREVRFAENRVGMTFETDALGLRARGGDGPPGAAPTADVDGALRIVVLGDSVAFGLGLDVRDALAAQLERELAAAGITPAPACFGVALPSWNARNAWRFLLDHLDHYRPDIVLYLPVNNDLEDGYAVTEAGERRGGEDPCATHPLLDVRPEWGYLGLRLRELRAAGADPAEIGRRVGPQVLYGGASPLSRARFAEMAAEIARGARRLERAGAKLALVPYERSDFHVELRAELQRAGTRRRRPRRPGPRRCRPAPRACPRR
jgi:hypothetical protein